MLKNLTVSAAIMAATFGFSAVAHAAKSPNISIGCFDESNACKKDEIGITNTGKTPLSNLSVSCPDKNNPRKMYKFWSFDLDPKETKCYSSDDIGNDCYKSIGIFVDYNVEIIVKSDDYPKWQKTDLCTWKK